MDKKKALTILGVIICIVFVCLIFVFIILDGRGNSDTPSNNSELSAPGESIQDGKTPTPTQGEEYQYDRGVVIKDITLVDRDKDDIIVGGTEDLDQDNYYVSTRASFSNGIAIQSTKYVTVGMYGGEKIECIGDDNVTIIHVSEINPLDFTPESKKKSYLNNFWQSYVAYEGKGFEKEDTELNVGLKESVNAYNKKLGADPTIIDGIQLLMDTTIETAVGKGYVLEEYSQYSKKYNLHAYIDCGDFRYLEVNVNSPNEDTLLGYLHDLMNNGIYIIE